MEKSSSGRAFLSELLVNVQIDDNVRFVNHAIPFPSGSFSNSDSSKIGRNHHFLKMPLRMPQAGIGGEIDQKFKLPIAGFNRI